MSGDEEREKTGKQDDAVELEEEENAEASDLAEDVIAGLKFRPPDTPSLNPSEVSDIPGAAPISGQSLSPR